jgi:hypothetical protein
MKLKNRKFHTARSIHYSYSARCVDSKKRLYFAIHTPVNLPAERPVENHEACSFVCFLFMMVVVSLLLFLC